MKSVQFLIMIGLALFMVGCASKKVEPKVADNHTKPKPLQKETINKEEVALNPNDKAVVCQVNGDERLVTVKAKQKRCEVFYTKHGHSKMVAWAEATPNLCDKVFSSIQKNIESNGHSCFASEKDEQKKSIK